MINKVQLKNAQGSLLDISLENPTNGYIVEEIDGLGPVKAVIASSSRAKQDGTQFNASRREARNIILKLALEPDFSVETVRGLRRRLYKYLMSKTDVSMTFHMDDGLVVTLDGHVESTDPAIFGEDPGVVSSIMCFEPDFLVPEPVVFSGFTTSGSTGDIITYGGSVETGIQLVLNVDRALTEFTIYHTRPDGTLGTFDFAGPLVAGDTLSLSTVQGNKYVTKTTAGVDSSYLFAASPYNDWIKLEEGDNEVRVYAEGAAIPYTLTYIERHGGL